MKAHLFEYNWTSQVFLCRQVVCLDVCQPIRVLYRRGRKIENQLVFLLVRDIVIFNQRNAAFIVEKYARINTTGMAVNLNRMISLVRQTNHAFMIWRNRIKERHADSMLTRLVAWLTNHSTRMSSYSNHKLSSFYLFFLGVWQLKLSLSYKRPFLRAVFWYFQSYWAFAGFSMKHFSRVKAQKQPNQRYM